MIRSLAPLIRKEFRQLLPWWLGLVGTLVTVWLIRLQVPRPRGQDDAWFLMVYVIGVITLGALPFGHEYAHHTLTSLLMQPVARVRMLVSKLLPTAVLVTLLGALGTAVIDTHPWLGSAGAVVVWLPVMLSMGMVPLMVMLTRGTLPAVLVSVAVPLVFTAVASWSGMPPWLLALSLFSLAAAGGIAAAHRFLRLETAGEAQVESGPAWSAHQEVGAMATTPPAFMRGPLWSLVAKEVRLHRLSLLFTVAYVGIWALVVVSREIDPGLVSHLLPALTQTLYSGLVPLTIGAMAVAEERRLGVAEWHLQVPFSIRLQWVIKLTIAAGLSFVLAVALPAALSIVASARDFKAGLNPTSQLWLWVVAVYVSSWSTNGMRALVMTFPVLAAAWMAALLVVQTGWLASFSYAVGRIAAARWPINPFDHRDLMDDVLWWSTATAVAVLVGFSYANYRTLDRNRVRVVRQALWLVSVGALLAFLLQFADSWLLYSRLSAL